MSSYEDTTYERAQERAQKLMLPLLTPEQREQFEEKGFFFVTGSAGGRYKITRGTMRNIIVLDDEGKKKHDICFVPDAINTHGDAMIAQKIMLENDEPACLKVACVYDDKYCAMSDPAPWTYTVPPLET